MFELYKGYPSGKILDSSIHIIRDNCFELSGQLETV